MEGRSRRDWKHILQTLKLIDVGWHDLVNVSLADAWKWLGWDAAGYRRWQKAISIAELKLAEMKCSGIEVASDLDVVVPDWFRRLPAVPWVFYRGYLSILEATKIGFSGQRDASPEALAIASDLASQAASSGFTVVSGGARGIDMAAHSAALDAGGATAVVLPQGISTWRPYQPLSAPGIASRVLAISEDVPWEAWTTESAMRRNRMIVDLADIFTVPQSGTSGGSHSTGMYALKQGQVTYVPDLGPTHPGNQKLLSHGAKPLVHHEGRFDLDRMLIESTPTEIPSQTSLF